MPNYEQMLAIVQGNKGGGASSTNTGGQKNNSGGSRYDQMMAVVSGKHQAQNQNAQNREDDAYNEIVKAAEQQRQEAAATNSVRNTASVLANGGTEKKEPEPEKTESDFEKRRRELNPEGLTQEQYKQRKKEEYWAARDEKARARNQAKADEADKVLERYKDLPREQWTDSDYYAYNKALSDSKNRNAGAVRPGQLLESTANRGLTAADEAAAATFDFLVGGPIEEIWSLLQASTDRDLGADPLKRYREREAQVQAANAAEQEQAAAGNAAAQQVAKYGTMAVQSAPQAVMALMTMGGSAGAQLGTEGLQAAATLANSSQAAQRIMPIINGAKNMIRDPNWLSAFGMTSGTSYEDALANGATEDQAAIYALLNGAFNATIETGGLTGESGLQSLPDEIQNALARGDKSAVLEFSKSLGSEILEEVEQGVAENALRRTYDPNTEVYSTKNENAVINPNRMRDEAVGAAITTALLGGGQSLAVRGLNTLTNTDATAQQQTEPAAPVEPAAPIEQAAPVEPAAPAQPVTGQQALETAAGILTTQQEAAEAPEASQDIPAPQAAAESTTAQSGEFNNAERPSSFLASVKEKLKNLVLPNERKAVIDKMSFGEQVAGIENGQISRAEKPFLNVSPTTPQTLIDKAGASQLPVIMSYEDAYLSSMDKGKQKGNYHNLGADIMAQIPTQMDTPLAIIKQDNGRIAEVLPVKDKAGKNLYVVVELNAEKGIDGTYRAYNLVISAFGANSNYIQNRINDPNATVIENNLPGAASQVNPQRNTLPGVVNEAAAGSVQNIYSDNNIPQSAANSNTQNENTPQKQKPVTANKAAKNIKKNTDTSLPTSVIRDRLQGIADYIASNNDGNGISSDDLNTRVRDLAEEVVGMRMVEDPRTGDKDTYDALSSYLKKSGLHISEELRAITDFNDWRKANGFKLGLRKNGGLPIDVAYQELGEIFGEGVFPQDILAHVDMVDQILSVLDRTKPKEVQWVDIAPSEETDLAVQETVQDIMDILDSTGIASEAQDPRFSDSGYLESLDADAPPRTITVPNNIDANGLANPANVSSDRQTGQRRSQTESNTLQSIAEKEGGEQAPKYYTPTTERQTLNEAMNRVNADFVGEMNNLADKEMWTASDADTGYTIYGKLMADAVTSGDYSAVDSWSNVVTQHMGDTGRALQAGAKWSRTGAGMSAQLVNRINNAENLTEEEKNDLTRKVIEFGRRIDEVNEPDVDITKEARGPEENVPRREAEQKSGTQQSMEEVRGPEDNPNRQSGNFNEPITGEPGENMLHSDEEKQKLRDIIIDQSKARGTGTFINGLYEKVLAKETDFDYLNEYALRQMAAMVNDATNKADIGQKVKTWQVLAQLSRLPTFARNIGGNVVFGAQDTLTQNGFALALDYLVSKKTKKRTVGVDKSWFSSESRKGAETALRRSVLEVSGDIDMTGESSKYGENTNRTNKMTGGKAEQFMSRWEQLLGYSLTTSDRVSRGSIEAAIKESLRNSGLSGTEINEIAKQTADYRLFQNQGTAANISKGVHDVLNVIGVGGTRQGVTRQGGFGLGDLANPYPGVPANLAVKALEYSPANIVKGGAELVKVLSDAKQGKLSAAKQNQAVMDIARGMAGVPIIALLTAAFKSGIARNSDDEEDPDVSAQNAAEGKSGVQINLSAWRRALGGGSSEWKDGDELMTIGWLEPLNAFMAIASSIADDSDNFDLDTYAKDYFSGTLQGVLEMPVMSNLANAIDTVRYSTAESLGEQVLEGGLSYAGSSIGGMIPAPIQQASRTFDPFYRDTRGDTALQRTANAFLSNTPLRGTLPVKTDNYGNAKRYSDSVLQRGLNNFVLPGAVNDLHQTETSSAIEALYNATGDASVYPDRKAPNAVNGEKLTTEQKRDYQKTYGSTIEKSVNALLGSGQWDSMTDEQRLAVQKDIKSFAADQAKRELAESRGVEYTSDWDDEAQLENPEQYLAVKNIFKLATKDGQPMDYSAIDALVKAGGDYSKLDQTAKALLNDSSTSSRLDDLAAASRAGIDSESWYHAKDIHDAFVDAKDFGSATNKANAFARWLASQDYTQNQQKLLRDQMGIYFTQRANQDTYNKLTGEYNVSADSAEQLTRDMANITPLPGKDTATNQQKLKAIATADYMKSDEERWQAFYSYAGNLKTVRKEADAFRKRYPNGTYAEFVEYSKYINTAGKS